MIIPARFHTGFRPNTMPIVGVVVGSWVVMTLLLAGNHADLVAHDAVLSGRTLPRIGTVLLFVAAWQVMTGAMMLPSSLPMVRLFVGASRRQERPRSALGAFLGAYFVVWTGFAIAALAFDGGLHALVERWGWLDARPRLIAGSVLVIAGAFQFSPLKEKCLDACRSPMGFMWRFYGRGVKRAWDLGMRHGLFCLGCCWALMLVMVAVGVGNVAWMAGLTGIMTIEKTVSWGRRLVPAVGAGLIVWGGLMLVLPEWLPPTLRG